jgi:hypothetical protein
MLPTTTPDRVPLPWDALVDAETPEDAENARQQLACLWVFLHDAAVREAAGTVGVRLDALPVPAPVRGAIGEAVDPLRRTLEWLVEAVQRVRAENRQLLRRVKDLEAWRAREDYERDRPVIERWLAAQAAETVAG